MSQGGPNPVPSTRGHLDVVLAKALPSPAAPGGMASGGEPAAAELKGLGQDPALQTSPVACRLSFPVHWFHAFIHAEIPGFCIIGSFHVYYLTGQVFC